MILGLTKRIVVLDTETCSEVDLKRHGSARYFDHKSTRTLMASFQEYGDKHVHIWQPHLNEIPKVLQHYADLPKEECMIACYNAAFDARALAKAGLPLPKEKFIDIMLLAYILAFAGSLDQVLDQFEVCDEYGRRLQKNPDGKRMIRLFSVMNTPWYDKPAEWARFVQYCIDDTAVEMALLKKCLAILDKPVFHPMIAMLQRQWLLNQRINERGIPVCLKTIQGALKIKAVEVFRLQNRIKEITGIANSNSNKQLMAWLESRNYRVDNLQAAYIRDLLEDPNMPEDVREVFYCRVSAASASVKKFDSMANQQVSGRLHGVYTLIGASRTGRDASRGTNLANMARGVLADPSYAADLLETGSTEALKMWLHGKDAGKPIMDILGSCVRSAIKAPDGKNITAVDLVSIESVGLSWLAGCQTVLDIFHSGRDSYKDFATKYYSIEYDAVTKEQRTFCKPAVLGAGYGASGPALVKYAKGMNIILEEEMANRMIEVFRTSFPEIPLFWRNLESAAKSAIKNPGQAFYAFACKTYSPYGERFHEYRDWPYVVYSYDADNKFLYCGIPSGRTLFYYRPEIEPRQMKAKNAGPFGEARYYWTESITYYGKKQAEGGAWSRISTWGGMQAENVCQALCRDVLYPGLEKIDADKKIELVLSTYDESGSLTNEDDEGAYDRIVQYMTEQLPWMDANFYLRADGYSAKRYKKG